MNDIKRTEFSWTSASGGTATVSHEVNGTLLAVFFKPTGGDYTPTNAYDVTLTNLLNFDLLGGAGANRSATLVEYVEPLATAADAATKVPYVAAELLTVNVTNAGDTKKGLVVVYSR